MDNLESPTNCKGQFIQLLIFTSLSLVVFSSNELQYQKQIDAEALLELKNSVKIDPMLSLFNWVNGNNICNWTGITCDHNLLVVSLVLNYRGLTGAISPHIGNLSSLTILDLSNNHFSGQIPQELGKLEKLQYIKLYQNNLQGPIPITLGECRGLLELGLNNNVLSGNIPTELSSLHKLQKLHLSSNNLSGIIPQDLANCTALRGLDLGYNLLTGAIPSKINAFRDLRVLILDENQFLGEIPKSLSNCSKLRILSLSNNALESPIPSEILTTLTRLLSLRLRSNKLNGSIPNEIGKLWRLREISISNNSLTGSIPTALANCSSLVVMNFGTNHLYGTIPAELGSLGRLQRLHLSNNSFGGSIDFLMNCTELELLALGANKLEGTIPEFIGYKLPKLQKIELSYNQFSGSIPKSLFNCSLLNYVSSAYNNLSGTIPPELGTLNLLSDLALGNNHFKGNIFPFLLNCTQLRSLGLEVNNFVGFIPLDIGLKLPNLQLVTVGGNQLSGGIPKSLGNCSQLGVLDLSYNLLTGAVPQELGMLNALKILHLAGNSLSSGQCGAMCILDILSNCSMLEKLYLSSNNFNGTLSKGIGNLSPKLSVLRLRSNNLSGRVPEEIGNLTGLFSLRLNNNKFSGKIPSVLGRLKNLQELDLSSNEFQGDIPPEFSMLANLGYLWLQLNQISGDIPLYLGSLEQLRKLDFSHNKLTGRIPDAIVQCFRLEMIDLSYNNLTGNIPMELSSLRSLVFYLNFSYNSLTGKLPSLGGMKHIQAIDVSANDLSGPIRGDIGSCLELQYLNLSRNKLEGIVPISIGQLKSLESIDLSFNNMFGPVPWSIANLTMLSHLNFSYNNFNGSVPNEGAFKNLSATSFLRNPGLCAASGWLNLANCTSSATNHNWFNRNVVLVALLGTFFALCCILGTVYFFYRRTTQASVMDSLLGQDFMQISSQELHRATQGFSAANLLGEGSFGSVYKALLFGTTLAAVKVFDQDPQNSYMNFIRECRILRTIRHRNLVKVLSSCSTPDFRALVLEYMSNGNLEQQLRKDETGCSLSLKMRVNIALDVAHGMAYLHHDCSPPVVHCDLKPSNVLMDETMTAHVADFGISRLLTSPVSEASSTSRLKGTLGYFAPEYGTGGEVSTKGDVYSFGILILEMVTKKRPIDAMFSGDITLPSWVRRAFPAAMEEVVDRELLIDELAVGESSNTNVTPEVEMESTEHSSCLLSFIGLGLQCTRQNPGDRPTMMEVEGTLEKMLYGRAYGKLEEHTPIQNLLSAFNVAGHQNGSTSTAYTD